MINEMYTRAFELNTRNTKEQSAKKISAEFHAAAYVSRGSLWVTYRNEKGEVKTQLLV